MEETLVAKKRKRGRPKGSKNREYDHAHSIQVPAACRKCGSEELRAVRGSRPKVRPMRGTKDGFCYHEIIWTRCRCESCGQHIAVQTYVGNRNIDAFPDPPESI